MQRRHRSPRAAAGPHVSHDPSPSPPPTLFHNPMQLLLLLRPDPAGRHPLISLVDGVQRSLAPVPPVSPLRAVSISGVAPEVRTRQEIALRSQVQESHVKHANATPKLYHTSILFPCPYTTSEPCLCRSIRPVNLKEGPFSNVYIHVYIRFTPAQHPNASLFGSLPQMEPPSQWPRRLPARTTTAPLPLS